MPQIRLRRDASWNWARMNPVLGEGEPAYETDSKKFKIGDGSARWSDLDYYVPSSRELLEFGLDEHINSPTPHPAYDDGPSFTILYQNAKV